jgi:RNA polymerase sigma-70 factor (ECF subfamily)
MEAANRSEQFLQHLTANQSRLYAYILTLLPDPDRANDVLQETNLVLWRKAGEFDAGLPFATWACKIAYFQVLALRRDLGREKLLFDDELIADLAREAEPVEEPDRRQQALRRCLAKLSRSQRDLLERRYQPGGSVQGMAQALGRTVGAISQMLYRIREALEQCVEKSLAEATS